MGRLTALALTAWIALTAVALVAPHWADGLELRSERAVSHVDDADPDGEPASDDRADEVTLFASAAADDRTTADEEPGSDLLGPMAAAAPAPEAPAPESTGEASAGEASAPVTHRSPDAQDRAGAAPGPGPVRRPR